MTDLDPDARIAETKAVVTKAIQQESDELKEVRDQARRYMVAMYGKDWVFRAPETFGNFIIQWVWAIASGELDFADEQMQQIEVLAAEQRPFEGSDD